MLNHTKPVVSSAAFLKLRARGFIFLDSHISLLKWYRVVVKTWFIKGSRN